MTNIKTANLTTMKCCDIAASAQTVQGCRNILHIQEDSGFGNQQQLIRGKRSNVCLATGMLSCMLKAHKLTVHTLRDYSSNFPHASTLKLGIPLQHLHITAKLYNHAPYKLIPQSYVVGGS
jgi:hypothetical protein